MSAIKGRLKRRGTQDAVLFQTRIPREMRDEIHKAAEASGVSIALYMEVFVQAALRVNGELPVFNLGRPQWEELPIPAA